VSLICALIIFAWLKMVLQSCLLLPLRSASLTKSYDSLIKHLSGVISSCEIEDSRIWCLQAWYSIKATFFT